ncbi:MAG: hypothetical protein NE330_21665 [Lentisphaeraceae bacterium]|nr:hypothetical protein [Lentisphaeraceae bacterium]
MKTSSARLQKYDFCERAFFFRYQISEFDTDDKIFEHIQEINSNTPTNLTKFNLKRELIRSYFYNRDPKTHERKRDLAERGLFRDLELKTVETLSSEAEIFQESETFKTTEACFVKHIITEEVEAFSLEGYKVLGNIDLAWYDRSGVNLVCLNSKQDQADKLNFMLCFALRELKATPDKINLGLLNFSNNEWFTRWQSINWDGYQTYLDRILSFTPKTELHLCNASKDSIKCNSCEYLNICERFSDRLDR